VKAHGRRGQGRLRQRSQQRLALVAFEFAHMERIGFAASVVVALVGRGDQQHAAIGHDALHRLRRVVDRDQLGGEAAQAGQTPRTATWRSDNPLLGKYRISIWYGGLPEGGLAKDAPFTVLSRAGSKTFPIDQTSGTGAWTELGVFEDPIHVKLTNQAGGRVLVDAVKFERLG